MCDFTCVSTVWGSDATVSGRVEVVRGRSDAKVATSMTEAHRLHLTHLLGNGR